MLYTCKGLQKAVSGARGIGAYNAIWQYGKTILTYAIYRKGRNRLI